MLNGRQIGWLIYEHFRLSEVEGSLLEFEDLMSVELKGDNLVAFENDWDMHLSGIKTVPSEYVLETLY